MCMYLATRRLPFIGQQLPFVGWDHRLSADSYRLSDKGFSDGYNWIHCNRVSFQINPICRYRQVNTMKLKQMQVPRFGLESGGSITFVKTKSISMRRHASCIDCGKFIYSGLRSPVHHREVEKRLYVSYHSGASIARGCRQAVPRSAYMQDIQRLAATAPNILPYHPVK
jgi:hypothetical protein